MLLTRQLFHSVPLLATFPFYVYSTALLYFLDTDGKEMGQVQLAERQGGPQFSRKEHWVYLPLPH